MNGFQRALAGLTIGMGLVLSQVGCAALTPSPAGSPTLQAADSRSDTRASEPSAAASKPAAPVESGTDAGKPSDSPTLSPETLAAIDSFLARTTQFESDSAEATRHAKPENERNDSLARQKNAGASDLASAIQPPVAAPGSLVEPVPTPRATVTANEQAAIEAPAKVRVSPAIPKVLAVSVRAAGGSVADTPPAPLAQRIAANSPADADAPRTPATVGELFRALRDRKETSSPSWDWKVSFAEHLLAPPAVTGTSDEAENRLVRPFWQELVELIDSLADMQEGQSALSNAVLPAMERLQQRVSERIDPEIASVALCRKVVTFGVYEEAVSEDFLAGRPIQTIVYSEIRHLRSQELEDGTHETRLGSRLELLTTEGASVWAKDEPDVVDRCRRIRSDFFIAQRISLPATLPAGEYVLKVFVEDKIADRATEKSLPLTIHSAASLAKG